ncbi:MAG: hypothetical protein AB1697_11770 [Pseudomonadota bacterium]
MRLPGDAIPPVAVPEDRYRIRQPDAVTPARAIAPHAGARQVYPEKRRPGGESPTREERSEERRSGDDRRQMTRRQTEQATLLDTRTGQDRRLAPRRAGDLGSHIDEVV